MGGGGCSGPGGGQGPAHRCEGGGGGGGEGDGGAGGGGERGDTARAQGGHQRDPRLGATARPPAQEGAPRPAGQMAPRPAVRGRAVQGFGARGDAENQRSDDGRQEECEAKGGGVLMRLEGSLGPTAPRLAWACHASSCFRVAA